MANPRRIKMRYTNYRGETSIREVGSLQKPIVRSNEWHPEPQLIMAAWDFGKKAWKDFDLSKCDFNRDYMPDEVDHLRAQLRDAGKLPMGEFICSCGRRKSPTVVSEPKF